MAKYFEDPFFDKPFFENDFFKKKFFTGNYFTGIGKPTTNPTKPAATNPAPAPKATRRAKAK